MNYYIYIYIYIYTHMLYVIYIYIYIYIYMLCLVFCIQFVGMAPTWASTALGRRFSARFSTIRVLNLVRVITD